MDVDVTVRLANESDMSDYADIVNHYIATTAINFRTRPQTDEDWLGDWKLLHDRYPWLVAEDQGTTIGVAYAGPWKGRNAYDWTAESTVYVRYGQHRRGIGRLLYARLLSTLDAQGYRSTIGGIAQPNAASVALHEVCGFQHVGTLSAVGFKLGEWRDVGYWQRMASEAGSLPTELLPVAAVWQSAGASEHVGRLDMRQICQ